MRAVEPDARGTRSGSARRPVRLPERGRRRLRGRGARGYSGEARPAGSRPPWPPPGGDASVDWIVVQLHPCACSSGPADAGSGPGRAAGMAAAVRRATRSTWSWPGTVTATSGRSPSAASSPGPADGSARRPTPPHPVTTVDSGVFDTSQGTVHLVLGSGGRPAHGPSGPPATAAAADPAPTARVLTGPAGPGPDGRGGNRLPGRPAGDAATGYGIAVFDVSPGAEAGGQTSITVRYYHADGTDRPAPARARAGRGLHPVRDVHPGPPALGRPPLAPRCRRGRERRRRPAAAISRHGRGDGRRDRSPAGSGVLVPVVPGQSVIARGSRPIVSAVMPMS